jgi:hypothetical protein
MESRLNIVAIMVARKPPTVNWPLVYAGVPHLSQSGLPTTGAPASLYTNTTMSQAYAGQDGKSDHGGNE